MLKTHSAGAVKDRSVITRLWIIKQNIFMPELIHHSTCNYERRFIFIQIARINIHIFIFPCRLLLFHVFIHELPVIFTEELIHESARVL